MGQRAAMNAVLKEEKAAEAEARREERDARKAAEMAEARIVLEAERLTREAEKTAARIRLEERRAAFEEKRLIKEAEELAERHLRKQKECESIKARALEDLKAAIERVERAQEAATMVDNDPTYEIPDDVSVGGNSVRSSRSAKSALGLPRVPRSFKRKGRGSLPQSNSSEDEMGLNLNAALLASRSKELVNGASGPPVHSISMGGDRLASFDEDEEREDPPVVLARPEEDVREQTIAEEGGCGPPKPDTLRAWLEWFMGDAEGPEGGYCSGSCGSCGSSVSGDDDENDRRPTKKILPRLSRKKSLLVA